MECINTHTKIKNVHILFLMNINVSWQQLWNAKILESVCYLIKQKHGMHKHSHKNQKCAYCSGWTSLIYGNSFVQWIFFLHCAHLLSQKGVENRYIGRYIYYISYTAFSGNNYIIQHFQLITSIVVAFLRVLWSHFLNFLSTVCVLSFMCPNVVRKWLCR